MDHRQQRLGGEGLHPGGDHERRAGSFHLCCGRAGQPQWVRYADSEDAASKAVVKKPVGAYVEKVYEEGNFAGPGIAT